MKKKNKKINSIKGKLLYEKFNNYQIIALENSLNRSTWLIPPKKVTWFDFQKFVKNSWYYFWFLINYFKFKYNFSLVIEKYINKIQTITEKKL